MDCGGFPASAPLAVQLVLLGHRVACLVERRLAGEGYNKTQAAILMVLHRHPDLMPQHVAGRVHVEPPSVTRALQSLERRSLVCRKPHPTDGRASLFSLTPRGAETVAAIDRLAHEVSAELEADLDPADREVLRRVLLVMFSELDHARGVPG